jgi:hypothetical protein
VSEKADVASQAGVDDGQREQALRTLSKYLASLQLQDQRLDAFWQIAAATGNRDTYRPGEKQTTLLALLGEVPPPLPDSTVTGLLAAAVDDLNGAHRIEAEGRQHERLLLSPSLPPRPLR